ncbi:hypothetical protein QBC34DRAFT_175615 [Podospora aff. communis PSN243]|uniref:FAD-binding FR-type domain-containing protein n=1 Tax=Podospora aff. communis PSN243 TaxID=3040156 RepID=A0AAV9H1E7_9PEZI|nr:hypothetical protein QBC34DRAFT_175615 [Podospora aff. communis PSN243]
MHLSPNLTLALTALIPTFNPFPNTLFKMATLTESQSQNHNGWHPGETKIHSLLRVPTSSRHNPTSPGLPYSYGIRVASSPLLAVGTLDSNGRPWTSLWFGERGFARMVAQGVLGVQSVVCISSSDGEKGVDPVVEALGLLGSSVGNMVQPPGGGKAMSALSIDLESRDRVKLAGKMVVGALGSGEGNTREVQIAMAVDGSLGNCPKYLNKKVVRGRIPSPRAVERKEGGPWFGEDALRVVERADMFFLSTMGGGSMDTNHRGGPRGFVRVLRNDEGGVTEVVYPEYSGNQLYQTLGNLEVDRRVGVVIPDFETGDVVYFTGETELLVGERAAEVMPHAKLAVKITIAEARVVKDGLPFRGEEGEASPYNPPVRKLAKEGSVPGQGGGSALGTARLVKKETLTPNVMRFTFGLQAERGQSIKPWRAGQYVTLDFSEELDHGWSHMRDNDPQSLNDDFIRTFTISSQPPVAGPSGSIKDGTELQITARRNGPATGLLWRQNVGGHLELPVLAFGGEESFSLLGESQKKAVFVAGGVGITPLLAQAQQVIAAGRALSLLWSLRVEDLGLAVDTLERIPGLAKLTRLFVTGGCNAQDEATLVSKVENLEAQVEKGRISQDHLLSSRDTEKGTKYYLCMGPGLLNTVQSWVQDEEVVTESFAY